MTRGLDFYSKRFAKLRVDRSRGPAPHKPILLLSVIELIEQGFINQNRIDLSPELVSAFLKYWGQLGQLPHRSDIALPFFHLCQDGFWYLKPKAGLEALLGSGVKFRTIRALRSAVDYAFLDKGLFDLLMAATSRMSLVHVLAHAWFPDRLAQIGLLLQVKSFKDLEDDLTKQGGKIYSPNELTNDDEAYIRDAAFRRVVISVYEQRCSFCGLKVINSLGEAIVDGSHIKPFSEFHDDRISNGICLCKNHHWAFDRGWFSIGEDHRILVAIDLLEESPNGRKMKEFDSHRIFLPRSEKFFPDPDALEWHRKYRFQSREGDTNFNFLPSNISRL